MTVVRLRSVPLILALFPPPPNIQAPSYLSMDILLNTLYTTSYVGSLFLLPSARTGGTRVDPATGRPLTRDTPHVLRARLVGVGLSSLASLAIVAGVVYQNYPDSAAAVGSTAPSSTLRWLPSFLSRHLKSPSVIPTSITLRHLAETLGLWKNGLSAVQALNLVALPLIWTASLFAGPLYTSFLDARLPLMSDWSWTWDVKATLHSLQGWRNYVVVSLSRLSSGGNINSAVQDRRI